MATNVERDNSEEGFNGISQAILRHMKKHQPNLYRHLLSRGEVASYVKQAQEQASLYMEQADAAGRDPNETYEVVRETWISLPDIEA